ncbi:MAG: DUF116 domain-containing protein [Spirochaetota bacterium]
MKKANKKEIPYSLIDKTGTSDSFYNRVEEATDLFLDQVPDSVKGTLIAYERFIYSTGTEIVRSRNEYLIELLMTGIFWKNHVTAAINSPITGTFILKHLYRLRKSLPLLKPYLDPVRGVIISTLLFHKRGVYDRTPRNLRSLRKLIEYLDSTGDFSEEMLRISNWYRFLKTCDKNQVHYILDTTIHLADLFTELASKKLSSYTKNVAPFTDANKKRYINRENRLFVSRPENEYHLNMVSAEILNREFRGEFDHAQKKIVLLPTCMQSNQDDCQATDDDGDKRCVSCTKGCTINRLTQLLKEYNIETRLIPHSSQFSTFIEKWRDNKSVGLIGVACVLNLIKGGYEMKKLGIPSQCVFLDYSGCKNHWHQTGIPTMINSLRLQKILRVDRAAVQ